MFMSPSHDMINVSLVRGAVFAYVEAECVTKREGMWAGSKFDTKQPSIDHKVIKRSIGNLLAGKSLAGKLLAGKLLAVKLLVTSSYGKVLSLDFI